MDKKTMRWIAVFAFACIAVAAVATGLGVWLASRTVVGPSRGDAASPADTPKARIADAAKPAGLRSGKGQIPANQFVERADGSVVPLRETVAGNVRTYDGNADAAADEEAAAAAWEALLDEFGAPLARPVASEDRARVSRALRRLPAGRRREAAQSLMNLLGDTDFDVMGDILLDRNQPAEVVEAVFNDLLNRPDEVKRPFLREIAKDEGHVGCTEARRILDVQSLSAAAHGGGKDD